MEFSKESYDLALKICFFPLKKFAYMLNMSPVPSKSKKLSKFLYVKVRGNLIFAKFWNPEISINFWDFIRNFCRWPLNVVSNRYSLAIWGLKNASFISFSVVRSETVRSLHRFQTQNFFPPRFWLVLELSQRVKPRPENQLFRCC